jgi:hypothetical protein
MQHIDTLESRQLFAVNTADIVPSDRNLMRAVAANEGETLHVRPDAQGNPIIGIGFQLGDARAANALKRYAVPGVSYETLMKKWDGIKASWVKAGNSLDNLKTDAANLPAWDKFAKRMGLDNKNETTRDIDYAQSTLLFRKQIAAVVETDLPAVFSEQFVDHPYDVQIALADMTFDLGQRKVASFTRFVTAINNGRYGSAARVVLDTTYAQSDPARAASNATRIGNAALADFEANSLTDYSGVQGQKNWYYGYNDGTDGKFEFFKNYNGIWSNTLGAGGTWTQLWTEGGHPNSPQGNGGRLPILEHAVRRYLSPVAGTVTISGNYEATSSVVYVLVDGKKVWTSEGKPVSGAYSINATVVSRSTIDFVITPAGNDVNDSSTLTGKIKLTS